MITKDIVLAEIDNYPLNIDFAKYLSQELSILRPCRTPLMQEKLHVVLLSKSNCALIELLFWKVLQLKFPEMVVSRDVEEYMKLAIGELYLRIFTSIQGQKDELINSLMFYDTYICNMLYYLTFVKQNHMFNLRFVFDCYHSVIFLINGLQVSDYYIQITIEKVFTSRFMDYVNKALQDIKMNHEREKTRVYLGDDFVKQPSGRQSVFGQILRDHLYPQVAPRIQARITRAISDQQIHLKKQRLQCSQVSPSVHRLIPQRPQGQYLNLRTRVGDEKPLMQILHQSSDEQHVDTQLKATLLRFDRFNLQPRNNVDDTPLQKQYMREMMDMSYILNHKNECIGDMQFAKKLRKRSTTQLTLRPLKESKEEPRKSQAPRYVLDESQFQEGNLKTFKPISSDNVEDGIYRMPSKNMVLFYREDDDGNLKMRYKSRNYKREHKQLINSSLRKDLDHIVKRL